MDLNLESQFNPQNPTPDLNESEDFIVEEEAVTEVDPAPVAAEEPAEEQQQSMEDMLESPAAKAAMSLAPGAGMASQYAAPIAEGILGAIPGTEELLENEQVQSGLDAMKAPLAMPAAGLYDFMEDAVEFMIPQVDVPELPEYNNKAAQVLRNLYSIIGPSWGLGLATKAAGTAGLSATSKVATGGFRGLTGKSAKYLEKLGRDRLFSAVAGAGIPIGSGVAVDYVNKLNQEGDNFFGFIRNELPDEFKFLIPEDIATTSADGPNDRRRKSVLEGAMFSSIVEVLPYIIKFFKASKGLNDYLDIKLEDQTAQNYQKQLEKQEAAQRIADEAFVDLAEGQQGDDLLDALDLAREKAERAGLRRMEQLDELSSLADDVDPALDQPMLGRDHEQFDMGEQGTITADQDAVRMAQIDQNDIANNIGTTHGRIRSMLTEAARLKGMEAAELTRRTLVNLVRDEIRDIGKFGYERGIADEVVTQTYKQVDQAGTELYEYLVDPLADRPFIKGLLSEFTEIKSGITNLDDVGLNAVGKAIDFWTNEYFNIDGMKASAYLQTSMAGEAADLAEGARRFDQPGLLEHAKEEILDRIEFLSVEQAIGKKLRGQALNFVNTWKRVWQLAKRDPKKYREYLQKEADSLGMDAAVNMKNTVAETKEYFSQLRQLAKQHPEIMRTFMLANELTDGNVHTLRGLAEFFKNNYGVFSKMILDKNPATPSVINNGIMSNMYNSMLAAPDTAGTAGLSNAVMTLQKPLNSLLGNARAQNWDGVKRGWYAYSAFHETLRGAFGHMAMVYRKLNQDPTQVPYAMREDYALKEAQKLQVGEELARAAEAEGNYGPRFFVDMQEALEGMIVHPVARFGTNLMGAFDGFTRAINANGVARFRAYDEGVQMGDMRPEALKEARQRHYDAMFNKDGFIMDPEVDFNTREMAMNLDHPMVDAVDQLLKHAPGLRPFMFFPRVYVNVTGAAWNHSFLSKFAGDYHEIVGPTKGYVHTKEEIEEIFKKRGIPIDSNMMTKFTELQNEIKGRIYTSTAVTAGLLHMILTDGCHGDGSMDPRVQKVRDKQGWAKRSCRSPINGKWYSYEGLGPIADHVAFLSNVADNFETLGLAVTEELFEKASFVLAASLTKRSFMVGLEPLLRMLKGETRDLARFGAQTANTAFPLAGTRSDFGKLLSEGNAELNNTFQEGLLNRNRWTKLIDPGSELPIQKSFIDGEVSGGSDNMFDRIFNFLSPIKVSPALSPEKQFLLAIEYDAAPSFIRGSDGIEYTPTQRSLISSEMGEQLYFRDRVRDAMKMAADRNFINELKRARRPFVEDDEGRLHPLGLWSKNLDKTKFQDLFTFLDNSLEEAKVRAERSLDDAEELRIQRLQNQRNEDRVRRGLLPILENK